MYREKNFSFLTKSCISTRFGEPPLAPVITKRDIMLFSEDNKLKPKKTTEGIVVKVMLFILYYFPMWQEVS